MAAASSSQVWWRPVWAVRTSFVTPHRNRHLPAAKLDLHIQGCSPGNADARAYAHDAGTTGELYVTSRDRFPLPGKAVA